MIDRKFNSSTFEPAAIHVCPYSLVEHTVAKARASHLVTLLGPQFTIATPNRIAPANHLRLYFHDISEFIPDQIAPNEDHIDEILRFVRGWDRQQAMLVHCWAGISRSTAAAFIAVCAINPDVSELLIARRLRAASKTATPNRLMIRLADAMLGRQGRMIEAIEAIGIGVLAPEGQPFALS
jgi:predicted protein tyrosine phosphatase